MSFTYVPIVGTYEDGKGNPARGWVSFTPAVTMRNGTTVVESPVVVRLDASGALPADLVLAATTDPATVPTGNVYRVVEKILGDTRTYNIEVVHTATQIDLASWPTAEVAPAKVTYELVARKGLAGGYAPLDGDAKVPVANLPSITGLGGQPAGNYVTTGDLADELAGKQAVGDYASSAAVAALVPTLLRPVARASRGAQAMVTAFQSGHGWTGVGPGTINLNDTSDFAFGSQCVSVTTGGGGNVGGQRSEVSNAALPVFDMTTKALRVWFKVVNGTNLNRITLNVGQDTSNFYNIDLAFPAGDSKNLHAVGEWFVADVDMTGASTIGAPTRTGCDFIRLTITDIGGGNTATIRLGGVALVDKPTTLYPNGVITIGFDDGYADQFSNARVKMDQYGFPATCYVIQDLIGTNPATYMSLDQLKTLRDLHGWEIAAHSATVANHNITGGLAALTPAQLRAEFETHKTWLLANGFAEGADHFAYPQGLFDAETIAIAREYFTTARTIAPAYYPGPGGLADPQRMHCFPISSGVSAATLTGLVDQVKANRSWLQVYTHRVLASGAAGTQIDTATFTTFVDYIAAQGVAVRTVGDVLAGV